MRYIAQLAKCGWFTDSPADIHGSVDIGVRFVTARATPKLVLALTVLFGAVSASSTSAAGIAGIDSHQHNASQLGFVFEEQTQLRERPGVQNRSLLLPGLNPFADTVEIFNGDTATGAFSFGNNLLGNAVINVGGESLLFTTQFLESALGGAGLLLLEPSPQPSMPMADRFDFASAMPLAIRGRGNVGDSKVYPKEFRWDNRRSVRQVHRAVQIELALPVDQIDLALDPVEPLLLILTVDQGNDQATFRQCPQADLIESLEAQNAFVIGDGPGRLEYRTLLLVPCKALDRFPDSADGHLCRQLVSGSDFGVRQFMDRGLAVELGLKREAGSERSRFVNPLHRGKQTLTLFGVRHKLQLERQFHYYGVYHSTRGKRLLPMAKARGFRRLKV